MCAKTFQRNHIKDKGCTEEIRLFCLPESKRPNPLRLCLDKFIYSNDFESESSWNRRKTLRTMLSSLVSLLLDLSWFTAGLNSFNYWLCNSPQAKFYNFYLTSVLSSFFDPLWILNPYMNANVILGQTTRGLNCGRWGEFDFLLCYLHQIDVKIRIILFCQKSNPYLPFRGPNFWHVSPLLKHQSCTFLSNELFFHKPGFPHFPAPPLPWQFKIAEWYSVKYVS